MRRPGCVLAIAIVQFFGSGLTLVFAGIGPPPASRAAIVFVALLLALAA